MTVTAVVGGTADYWVKYRAGAPRWVPFRLALPDAPADVRIGLGSSATDVISMREAPVPQTPAEGLATEQLRIRRVRSKGELRIISGAVRAWPDRLAPLVARYEVDWLDERSLGTCCLRLPAVTGDLSILSAQRIRGAEQTGPVLQTLSPADIGVFSKRINVVARYEPALALARGSTTVVTAHADVQTGESLPQPDSSVTGSPTWTCATVPKRIGTATSADGRPPDFVVGDQQEASSAGALSERAIGRGPASDCSALAVITETGADRHRDLILLLVGAVMSLGFAIWVELLVDLVRRLREAPS